MTQTVWIARHGNRLDFVNPEWFNTAARRYDPPLSADGFVQAAELAQRLKGESIDRIFASPFLRTIQTASEVAQVLNLPIKLEAGLSEWHNPKWMSEMPEIHPRELLLDKYPLIDPDYCSCFFPHYPETRAEVYQRTAKTIQKLLFNYSGNILIVGHGISVSGAIKGLAPQTPHFKVTLCCLTKIVWHRDRWEVEFYGDTAHLSQPQAEFRLN